MVLRTIGPSASEPTFQHAQTADSIDVEPLPSMRRAASTIAADLISEQRLDTMSDSVVVRLDDAEASGFVDELDQALVNDRADEIVIHLLPCSTSIRLTDESSRPEPPRESRRQGSDEGRTLLRKARPQEQSPTAQARNLEGF
jgi:hypothetical protein